MLKLSLFGYSHAYIHVEGIITIPSTRTAIAPNNANKKVIFKNCDPFTNCINEINNKQADDAHDIHAVMYIYNLIESSDINSKTSRSLWQYIQLIQL